MLKRYLLLRVDGKDCTNRERLGDEQPDERKRMTDAYTETERRKLRGHSEIGQGRDLPGLNRASAEDAVGDAVLPAVEHAVDAAERRRVPTDRAAAREPLDVEVRGEDQRQQHEAEQRERRRE